MNQQVDNAEYEFLWKLLANPADPNHSYIFSLQSLVADYPQSGALRALLMPNGDKRHIKHAAAYFNPIVLHKLATAPENLRAVSPEQIVFTDEVTEVPVETYFNIPDAEPFVPPVPEPETEYAPVVADDETEEKAPEAEQTFAEPIPAAQAEPEPIVEPWREDTPAYIEDDEPVHAVYSYEPQTYIKNTDAISELAAQTEAVEDVTPVTYHQFEPVETPAPEANEQKNEAAKEYEAYMAKTELPAEPVSSYEEDEIRYFHQPIEDEVYDEIVSIEDIGLEQLAILNQAADDKTESAEDTTSGDENYFFFEPEIADEAEQETPQTQQEPAAEPAQQPPEVHAMPALAESTTAADYKDDVSKYNDEKMPYTFMWWLNKTRREHSYIYQPYLSNTGDAARHTADQATSSAVMSPVVDELQQQYYQSIVSNTALEELDKNSPKTGTARKEDKIIERFIQEEPHIKHPADMKLDNENKAKRSSEDKEELVTETLARIYMEQMLYHKAIITYKKLMLKYPEKSLYFAGQIEQLENKIN